jgi:hypothetical protein
VTHQLYGNIHPNAANYARTGLAAPCISKKRQVSVKILNITSHYIDPASVQKTVKMLSGPQMTTHWIIRHLTSEGRSYLHLVLSDPSPIDYTA